MALVCKGCYRELQDDEMPDDPREKIVCPQCKAEDGFIAKPDPQKPQKSWLLTTLDKGFLRKLKIKGE